MLMVSIGLFLPGTLEALWTHGALSSADILLACRNQLMPRWSCQTTGLLCDGHVHCLACQRWQVHFVWQCSHLWSCPDLQSGRAPRTASPSEKLQLPFLRLPEQFHIQKKRIQMLVRDILWVLSGDPSSKSSVMLLDSHMSESMWPKGMPDPLHWSCFIIASSSPGILMSSLN